MQMHTNSLNPRFKDSRLKTLFSSQQTCKEKTQCAQDKNTIILPVVPTQIRKIKVQIVDA